MSIKQSFIEASKDSPIVAVTGAALWGITLDKWVLILGLVYAVGRLALLGLEAYWKWKDRQSVCKGD